MKNFNPVAVIQMGNPSDTSGYEPEKEVVVLGPNPMGVGAVIATTDGVGVACGGTCTLFYPCPKMESQVLSDLGIRWETYERVVKDHLD